jgi:hypothetical protein
MECNNIKISIVRFVLFASLIPIQSYCGDHKALLSYWSSHPAPSMQPTRPQISQFTIVEWAQRHNTYVVDAIVRHVISNPDLACLTCLKKLNSELGWGTVPLLL